MNVTLVQPPSNRIDTSELAPPLSLLSMASVLRDDSVDLSIIDLNLECLRDPEKAGPEFYDWATRHITATEPDLVGFTSMALESHVGLELARRLKGIDPSIRTLVGGPHFSAIAREVLELYPWIDWVVTGEGELAIREIIRAMRKGTGVNSIANVASMDGNVFRLNRVVKPTHSLNELPFPAYEFVELEEYFRLNPYRVLDFEHARGCALRCAFCYSPEHWGQGEQTRSIDRVLEDIHRLHALGARHLFFVADNFLNSKKFAIELSGAIAHSNPGLSWRCYTTLAQMSEEMLAALAAADCRYVFVGVDAVSAPSKQLFRKSYFRGWKSFKRTVDCCKDHSIVPTCAFMVHPLSSDVAVAETEQALVTAAHAYNLGCGIRLNPLTIYPRTGIAQDKELFPINYSDDKPRILFDGHGITEENPYARQHPSLFPFHSTVGPPEEYRAFVQSTHVGFTTMDHYSHTLQQAAHCGLSLNTLLYQTAQRIDYTTTPKSEWQRLEIAAFKDVTAASTNSVEVLDTLAFEHAEYGLKQKHELQTVEVEIDDSKVRMALMPHARVDLARLPSDYETTEVLEPLTKPERQQLIAIPNGAVIRYLQPMHAAVRLLKQLNEGARKGRVVPAPAVGIENLMAARLITLVNAPDNLTGEGAKQ